MTDPVCILIRNKPCKVDAFELALKHRCAFVGYAAFRTEPGSKADRRTSKLVPFDASDAEWNKPDVTKTNDTQKNRKIVKDLVPDRSLLIMPRMRDGVLYVGQFERFQYLDEPPWLAEFRTAVEVHFKKERDRPEPRDRDSSVGQILKVTEWKAISYSLFPAWLRKCVTGRGGIQRIGDVADFSAYDALRALYEGQRPPPLTPTSDLEEIERRLLTFIGPEAFEHLIVNLLQLEQPELQWIHVGGTGDGGVDGLCFRDGAPHAILQCKWQYDGKPVEAELGDRSKILYLAALVGDWTKPRSAHVKFIGIHEVASLLRKHASRVPAAISMRIQNEQPI